MDSHALLLCWEQGRRRHALDRALLLHAAAAPGESPDTLADRSIGERNAALLRLRRALFGDALASCLDCPACGEPLEFSLSAEALLGGGAPPASHVSLDGLQVRMPTTRDLANIARESDEASAARMLLERLLDQEAPIDASRIAALAARLDAALDAADACLDVSIDLTCPACAHAWNAPFDIVSYLWEEIDVRARRLLDEVHVLASAYGWTETAILGLSETRRAAYIERALA